MRNMGRHAMLTALFLILIPSQTFAFSFTRDLSFGSSGTDVRALQQYLNDSGFPVATSGSGSIGHESTFFGARTKAAVAALQKTYKTLILLPAGLEYPTGKFFEATRAFVNAQTERKATRQDVSTTPPSSSPAPQPSLWYTIFNLNAPRGVWSPGFGASLRPSSDSNQSLTPHITFDDLSKNYGDPNFTLSATSDSSGSFTFSSNDPTVATISGSMVTIVGIGATTITATEAADGNYTSGSATASLTINTIAPTITFNSISKNFGETSFTLSPSSNSAGSFSFSSGSTSIATISGNTVTIVGAGTTTVTAMQSASGNYTSLGTSTTLVVHAIAPTLTFDTITKDFGDANFTLSPSSNSSGSFSFSSDNPSVATISGSTVTIVGAGTSVITATQAASSNYTSSTTTSTLTVNAIAPTLGSFSNVTKFMGDVPFTPTAPSSNSSGTFTYSATTTSVVTISGSTATLVAPGFVMITATQAANGNYTSASKTMVVHIVAGKCADFPCLHGGNCTNEPGDTYQCSCIGIYSGTRCDLYTSNCDGSNDGLMCFNGGTCVADSDGGSCTCVGDYCGTYCSFPIVNGICGEDASSGEQKIQALFSKLASIFNIFKKPPATCEISSRNTFTHE